MKQNDLTKTSFSFSNTKELAIKQKIENLITKELWRIELAKEQGQEIPNMDPEVLAVILAGLYNQIEYLEQHKKDNWRSTW